MSMWGPTADMIDALDRAGYGRGPADREEYDRATAARVARIKGQGEKTMNTGQKRRTYSALVRVEFTLDDSRLVTLGLLDEDGPADTRQILIEDLRSVGGNETEAVAVDSAAVQELVLISEQDDPNPTDEEG